MPERNAAGPGSGLQRMHWAEGLRRWRRRHQAAKMSMEAREKEAEKEGRTPGKGEEQKVVALEIASMAAKDHGKW